MLVFQRTSQGLWVQTCCLPLARVVLFFKDKDKWLCLNSSLVDFQKEWNFCPPGRVIMKLPRMEPLTIRFWWDKVHWLESFVVKVVFFAILGAFHCFVYHISLRISFFFKEITVFFNKSPFDSHQKLPEHQKKLPKAQLVSGISVDFWSPQTELTSSIWCPGCLRKSWWVKSDPGHARKRGI